MISCEKCGKPNQDHYKFCLGCGSELSLPNEEPVSALEAATPAATEQPEVAAPPVAKAPLAVDQATGPRPVSPTPPAGLPQMGPQGIAGTSPLKPSSTKDGQSGPLQAPKALAEDAAPPDQRTPTPEQMKCPSCEAPNPVNFMFCGNCGAKIAGAPAQVTMGISSSAPAPQTKRWGKLSLIKPDGSEGGVHYLEEAEVILGRGSGPLFDNDSFLSPTHTRLTLDNDKLIIEDLESLNGVFIKLTGEERLRSGDIIRIGQELLRFDLIYDPEPMEDGTEILGSPNPDYWARLSVIMGPGEDGSAFPLMGEEMTLGRERGDILFSDDGYVSGTHAKIFTKEDGCYLTDVGSSNGTFLRLTQPRIINPGAFILIGQQLFRVDF